jgi:hypothetical protein
MAYQRLPAVNVIDDKAGKQVDINEHIGRRPIAAFAIPTAILKCKGRRWPTVSGSA